MNATTAAFAPTTITTVAKLVYGQELRWDGSEYHTGVTVTQVGGGKVRVTRCGKGDALLVDLFTARTRMAPVYLEGQPKPVAALGDDRSDDVVCVVWSGLYFRSAADRAELGWTQVADLQTALVALAFEHIC